MSENNNMKNQNTNKTFKMPKFKKTNFKHGVYSIGADIAYRVAKYFELDASLIQSVTTEEMNEATPRPLFSPMSTEKAFQEFGYQPSKLEDGLTEWK